MSVFIVGAGPGDPELITVRGLRLVRSCDVVVYDRLVSPELVGEAPAHAVKISRDGLSQDAVNDLLVAYGGTGRVVVRLKGGDPFVFGRGSEEALALSSAGIPFWVVPGVSSANAVPAAAGIPITHRGVASQVTFVAGHNSGPDAIDYEHLASGSGTLVFFMALSRLDSLVANLVEGGKDPLTPAAVIASGTLPDQRTVTAPLKTIATAVKAARLRAPALVIVGETVTLRSVPGGALRSSLSLVQDAS